MNNIILSPNMSLPLPVPGVDPGPDYALNLNSSLSILDGHNHAPGSGVQINPNGININAALPFNSNQATQIAYVNLVAQGGSVPAPVNDSIYVSGLELFYQDGVGNQVKLTNAGSVNATSSGISSGTATASFVSNVLVVDQNVGVGAAIDAASYILRYNGSYPSPSGNYIILAAPSSLSSGYQITLPATTPAASNAFLTESTAGVISYTNIDNSTLSITSSVLSVAAGGITATQMAANSVATASIQAGAVTQAKINVRGQGTTEGSGGFCISPSSGGFTSSGTSYTPVTFLSVTLTTLGNPVHLMIQDDATLSSSAVFMSGGSVGFLSFFNGGSQLNTMEFSGGGVLYPPSAFQFYDLPAAGTYTYTVAVAASGGGTVGVAFCRLVAFEIK